MGVEGKKNNVIYQYFSLFDVLFRQCCCVIKNSHAIFGLYTYFSCERQESDKLLTAFDEK